jgi:hypothetical protein
MPRSGEEWPRSVLGNFLQALTRVGRIRVAFNLDRKLDGRRLG